MPVVQDSVTVCHIRQIGSVSYRSGVLPRQIPFRSPGREAK